MSNVIPFPRKRGRPKVERPQKDLGTPELQSKRLLGETMESLDLCLEKGIITPEQHWCGIHLRWLYTLRYGAPGVRAVDPNHISGLEVKNDDPEWRAAREAEYHEAIKRLTVEGCVNVLTSICVHNERPVFLEARPKKWTSDSRLFEQFCDGLDILVKHWQRDRKKK